MRWTEGAHYRVDANDCWIWLRHFNAGGTPMVRGMSARRRAWIDAHDGQEPKHRVFAICGQSKCVKPGHMAQGTHSRIMRHSVSSILTPEDLREIRVDVQCGMTNREIAVKYGSTAGYIKKVTAPIRRQRRRHLEKIA